MDRLRAALQQSASHGMQSLLLQFRSMSKPMQAALAQEKDRLKPIAKEADQRATG